MGTFMKIIFNLIMVGITGGFWLIVLFIWFIVKKK